MTKRPALFKGIRIDKRLQAPISVPPSEFVHRIFDNGEDVAAAKGRIEAAIYQEQMAKLEILANNLGTGTTSEDWPARLAIRLAREILSGFLTTEETPRKGTRGRKPTARNYGSLWLAVLELRVEGPAKNVLQACRLLSAQKGPWRGMPPSKLADMVRRCDAALTRPMEISSAWGALTAKTKT